MNTIIAIMRYGACGCFISYTILAFVTANNSAEAYPFFIPWFSCYPCHRLPGTKIIQHCIRIISQYASPWKSSTQKMSCLLFRVYIKRTHIMHPYPAAGCSDKERIVILHRQVVDRIAAHLRNKRLMLVAF